MNNWRKCELSAENCGLVDGNWYILEIQGEKRPLLGQWDEKNARFVGSGLVGRDLDEAIEVKSWKVMWICECPVRLKENLENEYHGPFYRSVNEMLEAIVSDNDKKWRFE